MNARDASVIDAAIAALAVLDRALGGTPADRAKAAQLTLTAFDQLPPRTRAARFVLTVWSDLHAHGTSAEQAIGWASAELCDMRLAEPADEPGTSAEEIYQAALDAIVNERLPPTPYKKGMDDWVSPGVQYVAAQALLDADGENQRRSSPPSDPDGNQGPPAILRRESIDEIVARLGVAGYTATAEHIAAWTLQEQLQASDWAVNTLTCSEQGLVGPFPPEHVVALPYVDGGSAHDTGPPPESDVPTDPPRSGTEVEEEWAAAYAQTAVTLVPPGAEEALQ